MSEMVERVARAQWELDRPDRRPPWGEADLEHRASACDLARAAIEAMRDPSQAMVDAVDINIPTDGQIYSTWQAMIDAALK